MEMFSEKKRRYIRLWIDWWDKGNKAMKAQILKNRKGFSEEPQLSNVGREIFVGQASLPKLNVYRILQTDTMC